MILQCMWGTSWGYEAIHMSYTRMWRCALCTTTPPQSSYHCKHGGEPCEQHAQCEQKSEQWGKWKCPIGEFNCPRGEQQWGSQIWWYDSEWETISSRETDRRSISYYYVYQSCFGFRQVCSPLLGFGVTEAIQKSCKWPEQYPPTKSIKEFLELQSEY